MALGSYQVHLISGIAAMILLGLVGLVLIYSFLKSKSKPTLLFILFFVGAFVWAFGSTLYPIIPSYDLAYLWAFIAVFSSFIGFYIFFIFLELVNFDSINRIRLAIFSGALASSFVLFILLDIYL